MRSRVAAVVVLLVLGLAGLAFGYPLSASPTPVEVSFPGSYTAPGVVTLTAPGPHTVWAAGATRHDGNRCRIGAPDGGAVKVESPRLPVRWETDDSDAVDTYTAIGTFDAPRAGGYRIGCSIDPAVPGTSFAVTREAGMVGSVVAIVVGALCVLAAAALAVLTWRRR